MSISIGILKWLPIFTYMYSKNTILDPGWSFIFAKCEPRSTYFFNDISLHLNGTHYKFKFRQDYHINSL